MNHCFHKANKCSNAIARRGLKLDQDFIVFGSPIVDIVMLLYYDKLGVYYESLCPQTSTVVA